MKVYLATDHAGLELKDKIKDFLKRKNMDVEDMGAFEFNNNDDYPDLIKRAAEKVSENPDDFAIIFGKSGGGEAIVANKFKNVRAGLGFNEENVKLLREHNNANVLSLGSAFVDERTAEEFVELFLNTPFSGDQRHVRRIEKIKEIESNYE